MKRSMLVVLHGKQASNLEVRNAVAVLRSEGHQVGVRVTWESGDAAHFVGEGVAMGVDSVVAGGGDGTVNHVTQSLVALKDDARPPSLGIIPLGTANDFARSTGIPMEAEAALETGCRFESRGGRRRPRWYARLFERRDGRFWRGRHRRDAGSDETRAGSGCLPFDWHSPIHKYSERARPLASARF